MADPFVLSFEIDGEEQLRRSFSRFSEHMKNMQEPFGKIAKSFEKIEAGQFDSIGSRGGREWARLSDPYADWKARHYPGAPIMVRTGTLKESLAGYTPYTIRKIEGQKFALGTKVHYAIYHQHGGGRLPQRKLINLTEEDKIEWPKIIHRWVIKTMNKEIKP